MFSVKLTKMHHYRTFKISFTKDITITITHSAHTLLTYGEYCM